jgi:hypothetical protein
LDCPGGALIEFQVDDSGSVAVRFNEGKYVSLLPLTLYQLERYIWTFAPDWLDYRNYYSCHYRRDTLASLIIDGLSMSNVEIIVSALMKGRILSKNEWEIARGIVRDKYTFEAVSRFLELKGICHDRRIGKLYKLVLEGYDASMEYLGSLYNIITEFGTYGPRGKILCSNIGGFHEMPITRDNNIINGAVAYYCIEQKDSVKKFVSTT